MANPLYIPLKPDQCGRFELPDESAVSLYYELRGVKNEIKVVMLMGAMATCKLFEELADHLAVKYQVLTFNYRGVGQGEKKSTNKGTPACQTSAMLADDTMALIDHLWGPESKVHVFGASMGGWVAQALALKLLPANRLASLFLTVTTRGNPISLPLPLWLCRFLVSRVVGSDIPRHTKKLLEQCFDAKMLGEVVVPASDGAAQQTFGQLLLKEWIENHDDYFTSRDLDASAAQVGMCVRYKLTDGDAKRLRDSFVPIMVHIALHDKIMKPSAQQVLAKVLGAATLVTECGHLLSSGFKPVFQAAWEKLIDDAS